jgi:hypothetical protein
MESVGVRRRDSSSFHLQYTAHWGTCGKTRPCGMISPRSRPMEIGGTKCACCYRRMDRAGTASYPDRRVLLAGDAVHVQSPKVGHSLRPWRRTSAARSPDARSRPRQRQGLTAPFHVVAPCPPFLLNLGEPGDFDIGPWADRVLLIDAEYAGTWELPAIGVVTGPTAVLVRPDGYAAWVGDHTQQGLAQARTTWFGLFNRRRIL